MSMTVQCPGCPARLKIKPEKVGRLHRCPRCGTEFRPASPAPVVAAVAAAPAARPQPARAAAYTPPPAPDPINRTAVGRVLPPSRPPATPPPSPVVAVAPARKGGGVLRWALLGALLTVLLAGGGFGAFFLAKWVREPSGTTGPGPSPAPAAALGKWGAIDVGAKGIKAAVVDLFAAENQRGYDFDFPWHADANITLVAAGSGGKEFDRKALDEGVGHIRRFCATMREKHGVAPERIFIVGSSGLLVPFADEPTKKKNRATLAEAVKAATGCEMTFIDAPDEGRLGMLSCVPQDEWDRTVFIDIGGGNTKGGCFESPDVFVGMGVDFGSVSYRKRVEKEAGRSRKSYLDEAAASRPALLEQPFREQIDRKAALGQKKQVYLAGGAAWALATLTHPNDTSPRVELTAADVERYAALVRKPANEVRNEVLAQVKDREQFKKLEKEIGRVQGVFQPENLQAGAEILKALSGAYRFEEKKLMFFRQSNLAWPLGYVLEKNKLLPARRE